MSQLGMVTPFFHKVCGGEVTQAAKPNAVEAYPGHGVPLQYYCAACKLYLEPKDTVEVKPKMPEAPKPAAGPDKPVVTPPIVQPPQVNPKPPVGGPGGPDLPPKPDQGLPGDSSPTPTPIGGR